MNEICSGCLSCDRTLSPIGIYLPIFNSLIDTHSIRSSEDVLVCWECCAHLQRIFMYQKRVRRSQYLLDQFWTLSATNQTPLQKDAIASKCQSSLSIAKTKCDSYSEVSIPVQTDRKSDIVEADIKNELWDSPFGSEDCDSSVEITIKDEPLFEAVDDVPLAQQTSLKEKKVDKKVVTKKIPSKKIAIKKGKGTTKQTFSDVSASHVWTREVVSEGQMRAWREEDAQSERYLKLPHKCLTCIVAYHFEDQLERHRMKCHDESVGKVQCDVCECRFPDEVFLEHHWDTHRSRYNCLGCDYSTRELNSIVKHYKMDHSAVEYKCNQCDATFKTSSHLRYHKDDKHGKSWPCKHCGKTFRLRNNMYSHILIHKNLPTASCHICKKVMKNKYALKTHLKIHEEQKRTFYCQLCRTLYKTETGYKNHLNTSMKHLTPDKLKFGCDECGRRFVTEKRRRRHVSSVHLKKGEFQCEKCSKSYSTKMALRNHIAQKHDNTYKEPARDKICDICGKGFAIIGILKSHMRTHTGERPFQCSICPSTFSHQAALYTHNKLVHLKIKRSKAKKKTEDTPMYQDKAQWADSVSYAY